ncbi:MAG: tRNA lysidine(34) synthetase TilS [Verrucomicrobia bacterium]|nr:tRNA lysidine(34) synthetase TilS [Verrucomicrobiota bacterium]
MQTILDSFKSESYLLEPNVYQYLLSEKVDKILVACSGGADSVFALLLLIAYQKEIGFDLEVGHFNHEWRGEDSAKDAQYVEDLANKLSLSYHFASAGLDQSVKTETSAREARIAFLRNTAKGIGARVIAFGHQMDDILETQIQRLGRGSSIEGLIAPRPVHLFENGITHIRPILNYTAEAIKDTLTKHDLDWCEDSSNNDESIVRNKLRKSIIPQLSECMQRDVSEGASRSRKLLEEDAHFLDELAKERLPACYKLEAKLDRLSLRSEKQALTRRAFFHWLHKMNPNFVASARLQEQLLSAIYGERFREKFSLGDGFIVMNKREIWIEKG